MDKLIARIITEKDSFLKYNDKSPFGTGTGVDEMGREQIIDVMTKLEAYEDTELTPEQVREFYARYVTALCKLDPVEPVSIGYEDELICPTCQEPVGEMTDSIQCESCKQVLDWSKI